MAICWLGELKALNLCSFFFGGIEFVLMLESRRIPKMVCAPVYWEVCRQEERCAGIVIVDRARFVLLDQILGWF